MYKRERKHRMIIALCDIIDSLIVIFTLGSYSGNLGLEYSLIMAKDYKEQEVGD